MNALPSVLGTALLCAACSDPTDQLSDYDAGAVVMGTVHHAAGGPFAGAAVQVIVRPSGCADEGLVTSVTRSVRFDARRTDTLEVDLVF